MRTNGNDETEIKSHATRPTATDLVSMMVTGIPDHAWDMPSLLTLTERTRRRYAGLTGLR
jgi:hypothetical protein